MAKEKQKRIRVLLADDHPFVREGVRAHLAEQKIIDLVDEATEGEETIRKVRNLRPDVLVLDIRMPGADGLDVARQLRRTVPETKIIAFTAHDNEGYVLDMIRLGAKGYVLKDAPPSELVNAIQAVHEGRTFYSSRISKLVVDDYLKHTKLIEKTSESNLSKREQEVLALLAKGYTNKEIGHCFGVSPRTIEAHRAHIRQKLGLDRMADLIGYAVKSGIATME